VLPAAWEDKIYFLVEPTGIKARNEEMKSTDDFDWVKARIACSPFAVFQQLQLGCERDVAERNEPSVEPVLFRTVADRESFVVFREGGRLSAVVEFSWSRTGIAVRRDGSPFLEAIPTLNDDGDCLLKVGEDELTCWQFRKRALEDLLFGL
jgi:hypothetical protein